MAQDLISDFIWDLWAWVITAMSGYRGSRGSGGGWGQSSEDDQWGRGYGRSANSVHNPYEIKMPKFSEPIYEGQKLPEDTSIVVVDNSDDRMASPFQACLVPEIMANAASSINVLTERDQVMSPSSGFSVALFANYYVAHHVRKLHGPEDLQ